MCKLIVVGSMNMDVVSDVKQFPQPGETIGSSGTAFYPGGKGGNQAVAAARSGALCAMVGAVGTDPFGDSLIAGLADSGVQTDAVMRVEGTSGLALITVNEDGENTIVLSAGANGRLAAGDVERLADWEEADAVLLQNEIAWETTEAVIVAASSKGVRVLFNPAPARPLPEHIFPHLDTLVMNETEASLITGISVHDAASAAAAAQWAIRQGTSSVIITLGEAGCFYLNEEGGSHLVPAFRVKAVDTTAAGDTFIGAYAAASSVCIAAEQALTYASAAAALAVTGAGAQSSIPEKRQVEQFLQQHV
ncbi:ribokinase [Paenibacillus sp. J5C_2022]|uniref:ribokinase n=1 Tax=Paenibacillus sp. J5C2022 TaxID=2977129 RepID=UPI0021D20F8D|nr:ribokinase [Paenibacillus sp. J5C2022]MCU6711617.1 ribokinase [Paenibacillus sp. J5C2022]